MTHEAHQKADLRKAMTVLDPNVADKAAMELAIVMSRGARVVSWAHQQAAENFFNDHGLYETLIRVMCDAKKTKTKKTRRKKAGKASKGSSRR